ncbi:FAD-dependent monooxygenase [Pseudomonas japonica]|uniref:3-(3-hydroxy-phenyl)propionate hydroxylase n=1 Tax=Pseudomonas japonica TaxID=256466 RepID=A0A239GGH4_9PSED|nr:FAD-dependent monooxygenase [Pseudomonas japonica]SNS67852.1 3-(3-hydroxy-phenyl)propionate hydroxylase [Pseudomonas japonica]
MHQPSSLTYATPPELRLGTLRKVPIAIVGAGLVGLTLALDLARRGVASVVVEARQTLIEGSRAIVFAQRSLEILGRLGLPEALREKGVDWQLGRVFHKDQEVFSFDFQPEPGFRSPAFLNIQQTYIEEWLVQACLATGLVDLRCLSRVVGVEQQPLGATLSIECPDGAYRLQCDWLVACDGARSTVRTALDLPFIGKVFDDHFLIVDVEMKPDFPAERRFWFDPPFHPNHSVLLHKQPDDLWRVDFQLGPEADPAVEREPQRVAARLRAMFGEGTPLRIDWISVYTFRCRRLESFVHSRVIFAGDSAHQVSPFGGRGGNGGIQDADNLAWRLAGILLHGASPSLLHSYDEERVFAADENILNSTRSADFITPPSRAAHVLREAALALAGTTSWGRALINSGRLSRPARLEGVGQFDQFAHPGGARIAPGTAAPDAPVTVGGEPAWLLDHLGRRGFTVLFYEPAPGRVPATIASAYPVDLLVVSAGEPAPGQDLVWDHRGLVAARYGLQPGDVLIVRPDQHVLTLLAFPDPAAIARSIALAAATGLPVHAQEYVS